MKTGRYNLKDLLTHNEIDQVIIPEIQRDYVWQKENVEKLFDSIRKNYNEKNACTYDFKIYIGAEPAKEDSINTYLLNQYQKLKHNLKIGFIYAYHEREYAGKFFLIDGQQRLTTLYLLLLALYSKANKADIFKMLYYKDGNLKLDYKVREESHTFLNDFVKAVLEQEDFENSYRFYEIYKKDETVKNLLSNYKTICFELENIENIDNFLDYIENYIEFNYFDTHLSEQGEQLYIYMNSRGENLSSHEIIRAAIVEKAGKEILQKKKIGKDWECWQNFFWKHRNGNVNADIGFNEFLKYCAFIHICTYDNDSEIFRGHGDTVLSIREAKAYNYLRQFKYHTKENEEQLSLLSAYIVKYLDADYINSLFNSLEETVEIQDEFIPFNKKILNNTHDAKDYVTHLPILHYIANNTWDETENRNLDIQRITMYLKNVAYFDAVRRDPVLYAVDAIELMGSLTANKKDILCLLEQKENTVFPLSERKKLEHYSKAGERRSDLEKFVWEITLNEELSGFLRGDVSIFFDCLEDIVKEDIIYNETQIYLLRKIKEVFEKVIMAFHKEDLLRRVLLTFDGDITIEERGGTVPSIGYWIQRYSFVANDQWQSFVGENGKASIITLVKELIEEQNILDEESIKKYFNKKIESYTQKDWKEAFIKVPEVLSYCADKKILSENDKRIILLSGFKASEGKAVEIQNKILETFFKDKKCKTLKRNLCAFHFLPDADLTPQEYENEQTLCLLVEYTNKKWMVKLKAKDETYLSLFVDGWTFVKDDFECVAIKSEPLYKDNETASIMEDVKNVQDKLVALFEEIKTILNQ